MKNMQNATASNKADGGGPVYTIRKGGLIVVESSLPGCGYTAQELKELAAGGFELYQDGKKVKRR